MRERARERERERARETESENIWRGCWGRRSGHWDSGAGPDGRRDRRPPWEIMEGGVLHRAPAGFRQKDGVLSATSKGRFTGMKRLEVGSLSGG